MNLFEKPAKQKRTSSASGKPKASKDVRLIMPEVPVTTWRVPDSFPDLSDARIISLDIESYDPDITNGPGFVRGKAHVVGVSIATDTGFVGYFPVRHELGGNLNPNAVFNWLKRELGREHQLKVGHNLMYDLEGLMVEGVMAKGKLFDTQYAAAMLDEYRREYSLESVASDVLGDHKEGDALYKWLAMAYGGQPTRKGQIANLYRAPVSLVGMYAEQDAKLPLRLYEIQSKQLAEQGMQELVAIEMNLIHLYLKMRKTGVRVDVASAELVKEKMLERIAVEKKKYGDIDIWAVDSLAQFFKYHGIVVPTTATGKNSVTVGWLESQKHPVVNTVQELRRLDKFVGTFIDGYILNAHVDGRVYGQFHALRGENGGTVSGRLSSSCPNLQNVPARDEELGPMIRGMYIPEHDEDWGSADYSQIEPRILLHYANGEVATEMRNAYSRDKDTDFYDYLVHQTGVSRRQSKTLSLGSMYGMGKAKLADELNLPIAAATVLFDKFHGNLPFLADLTSQVTQAANGRGFIKTILNRRAHFDLWESSNWEESKMHMPLSREEAIEKWGNRIRRAGTHKALNRLIQGSAADIYKASLSKCLDSGIFDVLSLLLMVHDENDVSVPRTAEGKQAFAEMVNIMETCVSLSLPLKVDAKIASNWGEAH